MKHEKLPLSSKKFLAYLLADIGWKIILGILIYKNCEGKQLVLLLTIVIVSGFVQTGYILGQAALDRYVRIAEITTNLNKNKKEKQNVLELERELEETNESGEF